MTAARISIRLMGVIIALVAVECAAFQPLLSGDCYWAFWVNAIALPMPSAWIMRCAEISMAFALSTVVTAALLLVAFCGGWLGAHLHRFNAPP
jgi:hypothetical protein